jgi:hypothetical protein
MTAPASRLAEYGLWLHTAYLHHFQYYAYYDEEETRPVLESRKVSLGGRSIFFSADPHFRPTSTIYGQKKYHSFRVRVKGRKWSGTLHYDGDSGVRVLVINGDEESLAEDMRVLRTLIDLDKKL